MNAGLPRSKTNSYERDAYEDSYRLLRMAGWSFWRYGFEASISALGIRHYKRICPHVFRAARESYFNSRRGKMAKLKSRDQIPF